MATYTKSTISGSSNGLGIKVVATTTPGTTIHTSTTALTTDDNYDEVYLWAVNSDTTDRKLTVEYGGTASPDRLIEYTVPAESGLKLICPGLLIQNSLVITAFCATANVVMIYGYVNKIRS